MNGGRLKNIVRRSGRFDLGIYHLLRCKPLNSNACYTHLGDVLGEHFHIGNAYF